MASGNFKENLCWRDVNKVKKCEVVPSVHKLSIEVVKDKEIFFNISKLYSDAKYAQASCLEKEDVLNKRRGNARYY